MSTQDVDPAQLGFVVTVNCYDGPFWTLVYIVKTVRVLALFGILIVLEKVYLERYFDATYIGSMDTGRKPPDITAVPFLVFGIEALLFMIIYSLLLLCEAYMKTPSNTFIIDSGFMVAIVIDFFVTTACACIISAGIMYVVKQCMLRYDVDGMRGIRAAFTLIRYTVGLVYLPAVSFSA